MSRHIRLGGGDVDVEDSAFYERLEDANSNREHQLRVCQAGGVPMYIARIEDRISWNGCPHRCDSLMIRSILRCNMPMNTFG